ncbi:MAG: response regulator [Verrucomicrobiia bacterium]
MNGKFADTAYGVNTPWRQGTFTPNIENMKINGLLTEGEPAGALVQSHANLRPRILVIDEDNDLRQLYTEALVRPGYHVDAVEDGATGWEALQANNYTLLITEHSLPKLTGIELVRKLRAARMALPVVLAAARLSKVELALDPALQLAAVLPKPFYISQLLETVKTVLRATDSPCEGIVPLPDWRTQPSAPRLRL